MKHIMLATDFSERSDRALRRAVLLARAHDAVVDILHVVDDDRPRRLVDHEVADARALLDQQAETLGTFDGVRAETEVVLADPFEGIVRAANERRPDLLVLGPHRRQFLRDAFTGTTAERTVRRVACPVLTTNGPPVGPYQNILLTTDLSEASKAALKQYRALGLQPEARHSVLHVFDVLPLRLAMSGSLPQEDHDHHVANQAAVSRQDLAAFITGLAGPSMTAVVRYGETTPAGEVLKAADQLGSDLVVMATQSRGAVARVVLGSVTQQVLQSASVDVLTIPPPAQG